MTSTAGTETEQPKEDGSDMPTPANSPWAPGSGPGYRRYFRPAGADVRASDAERTEVADRLSKHYSDGRLDQTEFNERLDRAMNAKTRADFHGLFFDLPDLPDESDKNSKNSKNGQQRFDPMRMQQRQDSRMRQRSTFSYLSVPGRDRAGRDRRRAHGAALRVPLADDRRRRLLFPAPRAGPPPLTLNRPRIISTEDPAHNRTVTGGSRGCG